jgi:cytochrome b561
VAVRNSSVEWGSLAKALHWLMAIGVIAAAAIALISEDLSSSRQRYEWMVNHKSIGLTLLGLLLLRLAWRMLNPTPALPAGLPVWQHWAAKASHGLLYLLLLWMPLTGWLAHSASGLPLKWFGLYRVPGLIEKDSGAKHLAEDLHEIGFWVLVVLFTLHVLAALKHHLLDRDDVLRRMLPWVHPRGPH